MTNRREFLAGLSAGAATLAMPGIGRAFENRQLLEMPALLDATDTGNFDLVAMAGKTNFLGGAETNTWGYNQPYLGPTLRVRNKGETQASVRNDLPEEISVHWHGLVIPGDVDGGPHQPVAPGTTWAPLLPIDQDPATLWYHSHIHGKTADQVYRGLAGILQLTDGRDDERGLPSTYGEDDLTLVLQDRRFDRDGRMSYNLSMEDSMMGFAGDMMLVNGQYLPAATVPKGVVRLRLINGSNARIYTLAIDDGRDMHLVGTDAGLLDKPISLQMITLAPGERIEVLVDFSDGRDVALVSGPELNSGGMMGGMMGGSSGMAQGFTILPFAVDATRKARIDKLPENIGGSRPAITATPVVTRNFTLDMRMGPMMMFGGKSRFSISGEAFDMKVMNHAVKLDTVEHWIISASMLMHPFHVHGVAFQVLSENGGPVRAQNRGWKDTVLVNGQVEILVPFNRPADKKYPFMYHCHILEHEDGGMMGQFTVS